MTARVILSFIPLSFVLIYILLHISFFDASFFILFLSLSASFFPLYFVAIKKKIVVNEDESISFFIEIITSLNQMNNTLYIAFNGFDHLIVLILIDDICRYLINFKFELIFKRTSD